MPAVPILYSNIHVTGMTLLSNTDTASILCGALQLSGVHLSVLFWHYTLTAENKNVFSYAVS